MVGRKRVGYMLLLVMVTSMGLVGCVEEGPQGEAGAPGPSGQGGEVIVVTNPSEPSEPLPADTGLTPRQAQPRVHVDSAALPAGVPQVDVVTSNNQPHLRMALRLTDDNGDPIDRSVLSDLRFTLSRLSIDSITGLTRWLSLIFRTQTSTQTGLSVQQPNDESNGTLESLGNGVYRYIFVTPLPAAYDPTQTYRIGIQARRRVGDRQFVDNTTLDFRPDGNPNLLTREVVQSANCQRCHEPFAFHGGIRTEVKVCVQCHTTQNADPDTLDPIPGNEANLHFNTANPSAALPNPLDFGVMVHRIHQGKTLLDDGISYKIIGFGNSVNDYSEVVFPQDIRNCSTCHTGTTEADHYKTSPSRNACGSCHIRTWFGDAAATPPSLANHGGGPQDDDTRCTSCHIAEGANEFDISVRGAHTNPQRSVQAPGVHFTIVRVEDADDGDLRVNPGHHARVVFNIQDNAGHSVPPSSMAVLTLTLAGPTTDYRLQDYNGDGNKAPAEYNTQINARGAAGPDADGNFSSTFTNAAIPQDALGTFAVGMEGYKCATIVGLDQARGGLNCTQGNTAFDQIRDVGHNVVAYVAVTDMTPVPRRMVVDSATKCVACHGVFSKDFSVHGGLRNNTEYCVLCHTPATDTLQRQPAPAVGTTADTSPIHFKYMIHALHRGENLSQDYLLYAFSGGVINAREILYPGDLRNCQKCHVTVGGDRTELLLEAGQGVLGDDVQSTLNRRIDDHKGVLATFETPPMKAACVSCHDTDAARAHADLNTTSTGEETCTVCHGNGKEFAVDVLHAR